MRTSRCLVVLIVGCTAAWAAGQTVWDVFSDGLSDSACGVVNTARSELVVLTNTAQLLIVSRTDTLLEDTFVDADGFVVFEGADAGVIEFAEDGDGFRTLFWLTLDGRVVELDPFTAQPSAGDLFPEEFQDVPCDACAFVDFPPAGVCDAAPVNPLATLILNICGAGVGSGAMLTMMSCGFVGLRTACRPSGRRRRVSRRLEPQR